MRPFLAAAAAVLTLALPAVAAAPGSVSFSVVQRGESADPSEGASDTTGSGAVMRGGSFKSPRGGAAFGIVRGGKLLHTDARGGIRLTLQVVGGFGYVSNASGTTLELAAKVTASNDPACRVAQKGTLTLVDARAGRDELVMDVCQHLHLYANGEGASVAIKLAPVASASESAPAALVRRVLERNARKCELEIIAIQAARKGAGWRVTATVTTFGNRGASVWTVIGSKVTAADPLASEIEAGCP